MKLFDKKDLCLSGLFLRLFWWPFFHVFLVLDFMFVFTIGWQQQKAATFATWTRLIASVFPQLFQGNKCSGEFGVFRIDRVLGHHNRYHLTPITLDYIDWNILSLIFARCSVLCKSQAISVAHYAFQGYKIIGPLTCSDKAERNHGSNVSRSHSKSLSLECDNHLYFKCWTPL